MADQATAVTAELDNFVAASEFSTPHFKNDTCGEDAFRLIQHAKSGADVTGDTMYNLRNDMAAHGFAVQGGTVMTDLVKYFSQVQGLDVELVNGYGTGAQEWPAIHATLLAHAGRDGVVIEVEHASNLTNNEGGVNRHYVAIGGIHPVKGYLVGNGDDRNALAAAGGHGKIIPAVWMDHNVIAAAQPSACAVIHGLSYTTDLSAGAIAAPQVASLPAARIVDGSISPLDTTPATSDPEQPSDPGELGTTTDQAPSDPASEAAGPSPAKSLDETTDYGPGHVVTVRGPR
jgi:hypothetical protein